jgi:hypothetical protein
LTAARVLRPELEVGCVLARETGILLVLTDRGPARATYGARMLGAIARDRSRVPEPGEWVTLRRWYDGPVTVEDLCTPGRPPTLAEVLPWRGPRRSTGRHGPADD